MFLVEHVKALYRLLNHLYKSEVRILGGNYPLCIHVGDEGEFIKVAEKWNGKRNIYVGIRDRSEKVRRCATMWDIVAIQTIVIDLDPQRPKDIPSTDEELKKAIDVAQHIADWFRGNGYKEPYIAVTGNGTQLFFSIPRVDVEDKNRCVLQDKLQNFEIFLRRKFKDELKKKGVILDSMYDLPRITRVIGTLNVKGKEMPGRTRRCSKWLILPTERREDSRLKEFIFGSI